MVDGGEGLLDVGPGVSKVLVVVTGLVGEGEGLGRCVNQFLEGGGDVFGAVEGGENDKGEGCSHFR